MGRWKPVVALRVIKAPTPGGRAAVRCALVKLEQGQEGAMAMAGVAVCCTLCVREVAAA
jgi:hypothetical protein